jgi:hypothetical protein
MEIRKKHRLAGLPGEYISEIAILRSTRIESEGDNRCILPIGGHIAVIYRLQCVGALGLAFARSSSGSDHRPLISVTVSPPLRFIPCIESSHRSGDSHGNEKFPKSTLRIVWEVPVVLKPRVTSARAAMWRIAGMVFQVVRDLQQFQNAERWKAGRVLESSRKEEIYFFSSGSFANCESISANARINCSRYRSAWAPCN